MAQRLTFVSCSDTTACFGKSIAIQIVNPKNEGNDAFFHLQKRVTSANFAVPRNVFGYDVWHHMNTYKITSVTRIDNLVSADTKKKRIKFKTAQTLFKMHLYFALKTLLLTKWQGVSIFTSSEWISAYSLSVFILLVLFSDYF